MKKDIYVIKNDINNKVYVGQAINTKQRFQNHCKPSSSKYNDLVSRAIQKYGKSHFWYEILESQIENYDEREKYWISYYNICLDVRLLFRHLLNHLTVKHQFAE